ncbi:MAG: phosphoenolpyruvate synthase [Bacteroidetes bacterium GWC2_33_15]|nr:MAG: phosphoenolpyruvate synthase [Bacteroidetes bacterium GWA2_33_15]OFX51651.1 MAG: phosphoenolpyruvate synthase [Bacteroidetes bacterium GWC2_33_15]OFX66287.1 MAG: phosphoenolpyruvate synthase [Bacteroidetes bacterium GWB2_32_14]OFX66951.1 MAG: phosphoenolpyruvate synthase [Bacteroidetes bacterium GWD2_33_33]HAN17644.1 phosphoenolpyruvate synthase [Bacteroidales bacterium]
MSFYTNQQDTLRIDFNDTSFNLLMQRRIHKVLLIASSYDSFMLEEDGRIDEQIFNEYVSLNLRYPPIFILANTAEQAFEILRTDNIDLVISMLRIGGTDTFSFAREIKKLYPSVPIVVLTHFSREVSMRLDKEDLSAIDYVFCWLGNADLLLAIIKLIEDRMNVNYDVEVVGVQTILLVEDSIRYISSYLPNIYKIIFLQSKEYMREALNEHQQMLRMRGRPKILLATNYEQAIELYDKFRFNMLGIISDITYKRKGVKDKLAGIKLCQKVREEDEFMPFLLQSSEMENIKYADELNVGFIHKYSKTLPIELRNYIIKQFAFGEFIFRDPETLKPIGHASDLQSLQHLILTIPDNSLEYHASRNDLSKWLNARAVFPIAQLFKYLTLGDFKNLKEARTYIYKAISSYRMSKGRGVIAKFDKSSFDEYLIFSRIGDGSIGGKARGLAFVNSIIKKYNIFNKFPGIIITIPRTVVLSTDIFDEFMEENDLYKIGMSDRSDEEILDHFVQAKLPSRVYQDLYAFISVIQNPIAIRSSSKLEDSHYQPFAGIYSTYMIPKTSNGTLMIKMLSDAIKCVYASVYFKGSKAYMAATSNVIDEEKMGIVLQEVCGTQFGNKFYPTISGVARSINFYPIEPEKHDDGIANIAYGLGKQIVDGGVSLRFSPKYPKKILQLSSPELALKDTQKFFYALDMCPTKFIPSVDDGINLVKYEIKEAENDSSLRFAASTYDFQNHILRDGIIYEGKRVLTFANILKNDIFPLAEILRTLLEVGQKEMSNPIEIEFAVDLNVEKGEPVVFNFLQIRPIVDNDQTTNFNIKDVNKEDTIIYCESALGNGKIDDIYDFVYVKPDAFKSLESEKIAFEIGQMNDKFVREKKNYVLVGPGRWGTSDPNLGIPVKWAHISQARVIVESGLENYRIDPSQGTHFFQNLTSFRVGYFTINPYINDGFFNLDYLNKFKPASDNKYLRHIRFENPIKVMIDGKNNKGVILKENI